MEQVIGQEGSKEVVSRGDRAQSCASSRGRSVHLEKSKANRHVAEALGGDEQEPQGKPIPLGTVNVDLLHQSGRQGSAGGTAKDARTGKGRVAQGVWRGEEAAEEKLKSRSGYCRDAGPQCAGEDPRISHGREK
jgi:hypothetical protein